MKKLIVLFMLIFTPSLVGSGQSSSQRNDEEGRILTLETLWNRAEQTKDSAALDQLLAPSLIYIDYDGSFMTKEQFLVSIKSDSLQPDQITNETMTAHVYAGAAVVTGIYLEKGVSKGKPYSRRGRFTDTWINQNNAWLCVASQSTLISR